MMIVVLMITITSPKCPFPPVSFLTPMKNILEEAYNEIIGGASLFQEGTNRNPDKHDVRSNADSSTVDRTPPPTVSACSSRLTHSIVHDDLVQDKPISSLLT